MSLTELRPGGASLQAGPRITANTLLDKKRTGSPIVALTAYDYPTARLADEAGIDLILVGDSLAMVVLGYENTLPVTLDEMLHHTRAAARAVRHALLVADMPFGSYHASADEAVRNAVRFLKEAGAQAVKLEGGAARAELVRRLTDAQVPVIGHVGLTPQSLHAMGGYRVQGRTLAAIDRLTADVHALEEAGAIAIVLEGIPREVAADITAHCSIPTIGIGAGPDCDGQVLVFHDIFNLAFTPSAKFTRQYADAQGMFSTALRRYREDVVTRVYPSDQESYHLPRDVYAAYAGHRHFRKA
ncbi:MAG TPA: 3-methyl-2-oxobutanoate hydroxymethyltransferase [Acidobacteriaceae bacterium]|nr:3-methyl-2-oxobutanoate hydroxymethyltransferase [Acidobacteriaceae bacterium]